MKCLKKTALSGTEFYLKNSLFIEYIENVASFLFWQCDQECEQIISFQSPFDIWYQLLKLETIKISDL